MNKQFSSLLIKICILVGAFFLGLAARSHAQTFGNNYRGWERHHHNAIHFTAAQRQQAMAIDKDYRQKTADLFQQDNITLKQYKTGLLALQKDKKDKMSALLTQQQKDQLATNRKRINENRQVREAGNLEKLKLRLNLTDDQVAKLKTGQEALRNQARSIHENDNLLPQEKMEQMRSLMAKRNDTYRSVLTPDQYAQFEKMFQHHRGGFGGHGRHFDGPGGHGGHDGPGGSAAI